MAKKRRILPYSRVALEPDSYFPHQISITGLAATGTSSVFKELGEILPSRRGWKNCDFISVGALMRRYATEVGLGITEMTKHAGSDNRYDNACDHTVAERARKDGLAAEGRLVHIFMPRSFKVRLVCEGRERVSRRSAQSGDYDLGRVERDMLTREKMDNLRFRKMYPGCLWGQLDFDLEVDTTFATVGRVARTILEEHARWLKN